MERYINYFLDLVNWNVRINVHLYENESKLHEARVEMTKDELLRQYLKSDKCTHPLGTYIIPPENEGEYDILLVESEPLIYNLWHEIVHVWNYYNAVKKGYNYIDMVTEPIYCNWDEFQARKISTIMFFKYLEERGEKNNSQDFFDNLAEILQKEIKDSELVDENVFKYNLMQYLGFVSGVEEICKGFFRLPQFIENTPTVLKQYNTLNQG